jgi:hypothetical protein
MEYKATSYNEIFITGATLGSLSSDYIFQADRKNLISSDNPLVSSSQEFKKHEDDFYMYEKAAASFSYSGNTELAEKANSLKHRCYLSMQRIIGEAFADEITKGSGKVPLDELVYFVKK